MIVEYIRYRIPAGHGAEFEAAYARAAESLAASEHSLGYELTRCVEEPESYILRIEWDSADGHLQGFRQSPEFGRFFAEIRPYVDAIEEMRHYELTPVVSERPTIYDYVGGMSTLERLTKSFYEKVRKDDVLAPVFVDFTPAHAHHVAIWLAEVFGGPTAYTDRHGGHRGVLTAHLGRGITEEQRVRWVELILESAREVFPADELLHRQFAGYIEWGTGIAREVSRPGADIGEPGPTPRWGWSGLIS